MQPLDAGDPTRIGPYAILGVLGSGGMGKVYLGRSTGGRTVAVKAVRPELADDSSFRVRFRNEVEAAKSVSGAFTAAVVDADTEARVPWFATAFIAGVSLGDAVTRHGPLPESALRTLAAGLTEAISAIHRTGIIHRDLKPANVLLALDGPYVIDFGITRAAEGTALTTAGTVMGSPGFMSPEQASGIRVGPETDMFSLGATLVFAATGRSPFGDGPTPALLYRVVSTEPDITGVPDSLIDMISACLHKEPARRPTTQQITDYLAHNAPAPTAGGWLPPAYTDAIVAASNVMTHMGASGQAGYLNPTPEYVSNYGPGGQNPGTPPYGTQPQYDPTAQSGMMAMGGMGPGGNSGPQSQYGPGPGGGSGALSRRALAGLIGGGIVLLGGGTATAIALSGSDKKPQGLSGGTTGGPTTPSGSDSTTQTGAPTGSSAPTSGDSVANNNNTTNAPLQDPITAPQVDLKGNQPNTAWTAQTTDQVWGTAIGAGTLLLIGTEKTHGLDLSGKTKWPDIECGSGTVGILTAMDGNTVYCSGLDGVGGDPVFAIDIASGKVLWTLPEIDRQWSPQGVAGVLGNQVIASVNINVQGAGVMSIDKNTHKLLWKANTPAIGSVTVPTKGNLIFVGHQTPGDDTSGTITALDVTQQGKEVWHYDQKYAVFGDSGSSFFAVSDQFVFIGGKKLTALDFNGKVAWETQLGATDGMSSNGNLPLLDGQGRVFITADDYLAAVDAKNGKVLWQGKAPNGFQIDSPFAAADGNVYAVDYKGALYAVDAKSGATKWVYSNALVSGQSPTTLTAGNGKVFYTAGQAVMAFNADGK